MWVVGIDEAGYGPNLGPLVQAAVALRLPDADPAGWETLRPWVRRCREPDDGRLLIDDSKKVYAGANGLAKLETGVLAATLSGLSYKFTKRIMDLICFWGCIDLREEHWYDPGFEGPIAAKLRDIRQASVRHLEGVRQADLMWSYQPRILVPAHFNQILDKAESKAAVLAEGLCQLLSSMLQVGRGWDAPAASAAQTDPILFVCDKLGGRNFYGPLLAAAFPDGWVVALKESAAESRYRIDGLGREVTVVFRPKADGDSVSVAIASMLCKYLREVCMLQFNAFWQRHVPGLKPTAGYPVDAKRFYAEIRPAMEQLGIPADAVWRKK